MSFLRGQDAWRRHPIFSWGLVQALPGIREGSAAFLLYCAFDMAAARMSAKKDAAPHGQGAVAVVGSLEGGHAAKHH